MMAAGLLFLATACQKEFLQKPDTTGTTTVETVFSTRVGVESALANAYRSSLGQGLWPDGSINNGTLPGISGEASYGESWMSLSIFINSGFTPAGWDSRPAQSPDNFFTNFSAIRKCFIVLENVDEAVDMDNAAKAIVKAEMKGLIAYRYLGLFIRYGGVPLVTKALESTDDLNIPRASLQSTLDHILSLANEAYTGLPDSWESKYAGRLTRGAALAIKARALTFAARPLFNSAEPYLASPADSVISFKSYNAQRWVDAIQANEAVLTWAGQFGYAMIDTDNPLDDYGTATSLPNNAEVLLAFKYNVPGDKFFRFYNPAVNGERYLIDNYGLPTNFLENYYKADGTDQQWPGAGESNARPFSDYLARMNQLEPRFLADNMPHTMDARNNAGDNTWTYRVAGKGGNKGPSGRGRGAAVATKFYYKAGTRNWFEFPLFRIPEFYLSLAEAYNETDNPGAALQNLNKVHERAGLPALAGTDKQALRKTIQREWAIEFFYENRRFFDVRHWKLENIGNGVLGGPVRELQFTIPGSDNLSASSYTNYYDQVVYTAYWDPKMFLLPIPQAEIDKGILVQNPGY